MSSIKGIFTWLFTAVKGENQNGKSDTKIYKSNIQTTFPTRFSNTKPKYLSL